MASTRTPLLRQDSSSTTSSFSSVTRISRQRQRDTTRYIALGSALVSCLCAGSITAFSLYGHLFQKRLHYTQLQVNTVSIAAEIALYLPVSFFGYLCDRLGPAPLSLMASVFFGSGYLLAAFTYASGTKDVYGYTVERGWPLWVMVVAFVIIGCGTTCMYLSAMTTCAKNFGKGKNRGLTLSLPVAAFGLSGMWVSQVGSRLLYEEKPDGTKGDVDVFRFFVFLAITLLVVGLIGARLLKVVDEDELIDEAVEELERSGLLEDSEYFRPGSRGRNYGAVEDGLDDEITEARRLLEAKDREEEARKKTWLLNEETRRFLKDHTVWYLAAGFFFVSGPGETFLTNLGTIIGTLDPPISDPSKIITTAATHVSIVAITSTVARIVFGKLTDMVAPAPTSPHLQSASNSLASLPPPYNPASDSRGFSISRINFMLLAAFLLLLGQVVLASGLIQNHSGRFWIVSTFIGSGYGALFSLTPLVIAVIWGVENFGTNWGIVAMVPAAGATVWGVVYAQVYQWAGKKSSYGSGAAEDIMCYGKDCYEITFWAMALSTAIGGALWIWAWKGPDGWSRRGLAV